MSLSKTEISVSQTLQFTFSFSYFLVRAFSTPRPLTSATPVQGAKMLITARTVHFCPKTKTV